MHNDQINGGTGNDTLDGATMMTALPEIRAQTA
ncbi:hypothetical protein ACFSHQ_24680 [Gemmobacter lanyuensis]